MEKEGVIYICMYTHTHTHIYNIMEYYSAIKKNKLLLFAAPWMDLEDIVLNESQRQTTTMWYHLCV